VTVYTLGLDIGTTNCKAILVDDEGKVKAFHSSEEYSVIRPKPGWAEENPRDWWHAVKRVVREVIASSGVNPEDIEAIGVSSMEEGVVPLDKDGEPLYNCMIWQDTRTKEQEAWVLEHVDFFTVLKITGLPITYLWSAEKVLWLKQHHPEVYERTYKFMQPKDFINFKLTGEYTTDWSIAGHTQLFDIVRRKWSEELMEQHGISPDKWPEVKESTEVIGELTGEAATELGLSRGTKVIAGAGDQEGGVVGAGAVRAGEALESAGTASVLNIVLSKPVFDFRATVFCHPYRDLWIMELYPPPSGQMFQWLKSNFGRFEEKASKVIGVSPYKIMDLEAEKSPPGSNGLLALPLFVGKVTSEINPSAKAVVFGLDFDHTRSDFIRALIEGTAFELKEILDFVKEELKIDVDELKVSGGVANSRIWREIRADITGRKILLPKVTETTVFGDALLAGVGSGLYSAEQAASMVEVSERLEPKRESHKVYLKVYEVYRKVYEGLKDVFSELQSIKQLQK